jgi:hypothetical protein
MPKRMIASRVAYVSSLPHSGSTLMGLLLGRHPQAAFLGEVNAVFRRTPDGQWLHRKFCRFCDDVDGERCPVWNRETITALRAAARCRYDLISRLVPGSRLLVDSSKGADWIRAGLAPGVRARVVHVSKSVESFCASMRNLGMKGPIERIGLAWATKNLDIARRAEAHCLPYLHVRYEDLATQTTAVLERTCEFLEIEMVSGQEKCWDVDQHFIKGNFGAASHFASGRASTLGASRDFHEKNFRKIILDERWTQSISTIELERLHSMPSVASVSRSLGYEQRLDVRWLTRARGTVAEASIRMYRLVRPRLPFGGSVKARSSSTRTRPSSSR